jgi:rieske iron-sulfur protein
MVTERRGGHSPPGGNAPSPGRRRLLRSMVLAAVGGVTASALAVVKLVVPGKSGGFVPTVKKGDVLVFAQGGNKGKMIRLADLPAGNSTLAYPQGKEKNTANVIRLIREKEELFQPPTRLDWTDQGLVAYSAVCTHLACTVSWEEAVEIEASVILCHCHNGLYDPLRGARVVGGPPPRPLPQIAVKVDEEGTIRIMGAFSGPVGPSS